MLPRGHFDPLEETIANRTLYASDQNEHMHYLQGLLVIIAQVIYPSGQNVHLDCLQGL